VEFYPLHRAQDKLKYLAGSETGAGAFIVDITAEEMARRLRAVPVRDEDLADGLDEGLVDGPRRQAGLVPASGVGEVEAR